MHSYYLCETLLIQGRWQMSLIEDLKQWTRMTHQIWGFCFATLIGFQLLLKLSFVVLPMAYASLLYSWFILFSRIRKRALDRSAWRLAISVPELWPLCLLGFISSLPQLAWDKRLCCCCCCGYGRELLVIPLIHYNDEKFCYKKIIAT